MNKMIFFEAVFPLTKTGSSTPFTRTLNWVFVFSSRLKFSSQEVTDNPNSSMMYANSLIVKIDEVYRPLQLPKGSNLLTLESLERPLQIGVLERNAKVFYSG
jgi:hypothetical protein